MPGCVPRRFAVALVTFFGLFVVYVLRVILSVAVLEMKEEFGWSEETKGVVLSSFFGGYLALQVAGGYLSVRFGAKIVFGLGVLVPSILTLVTPPVASSVPALVVLRVLTGVGESVTYPAVHALLGLWVPEHERARVVGFVWSGAYMGTTAAFPLAGWLISAGMGWQSVFYVSGALGVVWFFFWWLIAANDPKTDTRISAAERSLILSSLPPSYDGTTAIPWVALFTSSPVWAVVCGHVAHTYVFYGLLVSLPSYLKSALGFDIKEAGLIAVLPYIGCFLGSVIAGRAADYAIHGLGWSVVGTRRLFQMVFEIGAAGVLVLAGFTTSVTLAVVMVTVSLTCVGAGSAGGYAPNVLDLSPFFGGILMGISNTFATVPGIVAPLIAGAIVTSDEKSVETVDQWRVVFWITLGVAVTGNVLFGIFASGHELASLKGPAESKAADPLIVNHGSKAASAPSAVIPLVFTE